MRRRRHEVALQQSRLRRQNAWRPRDRRYMNQPRGLAIARDSWRQGRGYRYPICCVAHSCWDDLFGWPSGVVRWKQIECSQSDGGPVPCGLLHANDSPYGLPIRLAKTLRFYWRTLQPTQTGRQRRRLAREGSRGWRSPKKRASAFEANALPELYWEYSPQDSGRERDAESRGDDGSG